MSKPLDELKSVLAEDARNSSFSHRGSMLKEHELIQSVNTAKGKKREKKNN